MRSAPAVIFSRRPPVPPVAMSDDRERRRERNGRGNTLDADAARIESGSRRILNRLQEWFFLRASRPLIAGLVAAALAALVFGLWTAGFVPLIERQPTFYVLGGLISGNLTVITVVVSINQLLLSRELSTPEALESQMEGVIEYRKDVEAAADRVAPVEPLGFLRLLFDNTRTEAQKLGGMNRADASGSEGLDGGIHEEVDDLVRDLTDHVDAVDELLDRSGVSTFHVLSATLTTNYAHHINHLRRLRHDHGDELADGTMEYINALIDRLQQIDVARQYFKSIYLQQELSRLSRMLFYTGIPAEAAAVVALLGHTASGGVGVSGWLATTVLVTVVVGLLPICTLFAYIARISTVTQRTAATIPFTTPTQEK